ncbi:hypothetical protein DTW90_10920 [Neorhizobium sp. P12A]|nr:hypothetical protein DTW90_10920 [Neorhizobium sp. P12A]
MRRYLAVFYFIGSVLFTVIPAWGAANERTMRSLEVIREDKSCYGVNRAYEKMHNSGRFTSNIYEVTPNDGRRLYLQMHEVDQYYFV